jgi:hypothetical protein
MKTPPWFPMVRTLVLAGVMPMMLLAHTRTAGAVENELGVAVELGPIAGAANASRTVTFNLAARRQASWYDLQDGMDHNVRGVALTELLARVDVPKAADAAVFIYDDGMEIPVRLRDKKEVTAIFIAFEHGDVRDRFTTSYPLRHRSEVPCPKVVYGRKVLGYSIWKYPTTLRAIRLVTWKAYEAMLAQPTRRFPDRSGWPIYLEHCQSCHGLGSPTPRRAPDFLGDMEAYRRVPPLAETRVGDAPSLHEKVNGLVDGNMPILDHVSDREIIKLWRWLHAVHRTAVK